MWQEFLSLWQDLWSYPATNRTVIGGAIAGFISALAMFLVGDVFWKSRLARLKAENDLKQEQLEKLYAPLYRFYSDAYARYDSWHQENPETLQGRQPFFDLVSESEYVEQVFSEHAAFASPDLLRAWSHFRAANGNKNEAQRRKEMIAVLVRDYHGLRKALGQDFDQQEMEAGQIGKRISPIEDETVA